MPDEQLNTLRWGNGSRTILAVHGITGSAISWQAVARLLPEDWSLVALDLRGRGGSAELPGPYGLDAHVRDVIAAAERLGGPLVLAGHSMGAFIALLAADARADLFERVVLVDGGIPLPVPEDADLDAVLEATLGPAIARLSQTFPTEDSYVDFFRQHPALTDWNDDIEAYVRADITGTPGAFRSKVREEAVRTDGRDVLGVGAALNTALGRLSKPTALLTAPAGMFGAPPGLLPEALVEKWARAAPLLTAEQVAGTNHYTIMFGDQGASAVAARLTAA
jgi:lipase